MTRVCVPKEFVDKREICLGTSLLHVREQFKFSYEETGTFVGELNNEYFKQISFTTSLLAVDDIMLSSDSYRLHSDDVDSVLSVCIKTFGDSIQSESYQDANTKTRVWAWRIQGALVMLQAYEQTTDTTGLFRDAFTVILSFNKRK